LSRASAFTPPPLIPAPERSHFFFGVTFLVPEKRSPANLPELKIAFRGLLTSFKTRELWVVGFFLFLYYFSPGFNTPLYYHMTDTLHFSQGSIGMLGGIASAGSVAGALFYCGSLSGIPSERRPQLM